MTNQQLLNLYNSLGKLNNIQGSKFSYVVARNKGLLEKVRLGLDKLIEASEEFTKFEQKRLELAKSLAKKDPNGLPLIVGQQFVMEDQAKFEAEFEKIKAESPDAVKAREDQVANYNKALTEEVVVDFYKIKLSDIPDSINVDQFNVILPFIEE